MYWDAGDDSPVHPAPNFLRQFRRWLGKRIPVVSSLHDSDRFFAANGCSFQLEPACTNDEKIGLLESATPECRSPRDLVAYQAVQDAWLIDAAQELSPSGSLRWLKNSGDAFGNCYGQQENYDVTIATGWRLFCWRLCLVLLLPYLLFYRLAALVWLEAIVGWAGCKAYFRPIHEKVDEATEPISVLSTDGADELQTLPGLIQDPSSSLSPQWIRRAASGLRFLHWPLAVSLQIFIRMFILVQHRKWMSAFLASRSVIDGSGHVDRNGMFWLSARCAGIDRLIGLGSYNGEKPLFILGHWLEAMLGDNNFKLNGWRQLFKSRQRLQISLGDSTPNQHTQWLRVGITSLVFDLIENDYSTSSKLKKNNAQKIPILKSPLKALRALATDTALLRAVPNSNQKLLTALQIQQLYVNEVRILVSDSLPLNEEAVELVDKWQEVIDRLRKTDCEESQRWLLGRVDWISKRWLIEKVAANQEWAIQKKIDLKYHEMSRDGYHQMLVHALDIEPLLSFESMYRAERLPPKNSPATLRGYFIREFADFGDDVRVGWTHAQWIDAFGNQRQKSFVD